MAQNRRRLSLTLIGLSSSVVAVAIAAGVTWFLYEHTVSLLTDNLRQRLLSIVTTQVANIDANDVEELQVEEDWKKPEWRRLVTQLKRSKDHNGDIVFMYIYRKNKDDPTQLEFVADAESLNPYANSDSDPANDVDANKDGLVEPDGPDYLQWPGQEYPDPPEDTFPAFDRPITSRDLYEDAWGNVLTGYAPIVNENGFPIAVLAADIRADDFFTITTQTLIPFIAFILGLMGLILILAYSLIKIWNRQVELVEKLDRQKDELISIVSHQLASPMTGLVWGLQSMEDGDLGEISEEQKKHVQLMIGTAEGLSDLTRTLLDVSRIELGKLKMDRSKTDLNKFFDDLLPMIVDRAKQKNVKFHSAIPKLPEGYIDPRLTRMTFENLLVNAVKYTPEKGKVDFTVALKGHKLVCTIADTGIGIPKAEQPKIFGKLFRASNVKVDGNGFGLYVAKGGIEQQGGTIRFESEEGKGTTFYLELPISPPPGQKS